MYTTKDIHARTVDLIERRGIAKQSMMKEIGLGQNTLANMKTSFLKSDSLAYIADYLGCSTDYLLGRTNIEKVAQDSLDQLSEDERELVEAFRSVGKAARRRLLVSADNERTLAESEKGTAKQVVG